MTHPSIEDDIRVALHHRADAAPTSGSRPLPQVPRRRAMTVRVAAMVAAAACIAAVAAIAVTIDQQESQVVASSSEDDEPVAGSQPAPAGARDMPDAPVPRLGFDPPDFRFAPAMDCAEGAAPFGASPLQGERPLFQSFGRS